MNRVPCWVGNPVLLAFSSKITDVLSRGVLMYFQISGGGGGELRQISGSATVDIKYN